MVSGARDPDAPDAIEDVGLLASLRVLGRRWRAVVAGLVATVLLATATAVLVPSSYVAHGTLLLVIPPQNPNPSGTGNPAVSWAANNPLLGSRGFVGDLVITVMADPRARETVAAAGGGDRFEVSLGDGDASLLAVEATGRTPEEALRTWQAAANATEAALLSIQRERNAPEGLLVTADRLTTPAQAEHAAGSRIRAVIAVTVLGVGATLAAAFALESLALHRRRTRLAGQPAPAERQGPESIDLVNGARVRSEAAGDVPAGEPQSR